MSVEVNSDAARKFLEFYFGETPDNLIELNFQRPDSNEARAKAGKKISVTRTYRGPDKAIEGKLWRDEAANNNVYFCSSSLFKDGTHLAANAADLRALWFDIDDAPTIGIDGDAFIQDLRETETFSCLIKTSPGKAQGLFLLDEPILFDPDDDVDEDDTDVDYEEMDDEELEMELAARRKNGKKSKSKTPVDSKKAAFIKDELKPLLWNICWYYGGDANVINLSRVLRLPGSLNIKYDPPHRVKAVYPPEAKVFGMAELRKRFKTDENSVPRIVFHAISKAIWPKCPPGNRHYPLLGLVGTVRRLGIDRDSCQRLMAELCRQMDHDDEAASVDSTYDKDMQDDGMWTLRSEIQGESFEDIVEDVEKAVRFWAKLKGKYCKAMKIKWTPERVDPLGEAFDDSLFKVKEDGTYWTDPKTEVDVKFANFSVRVLYKVIRPGMGVHETKEIDICEITFNGRKNRIEWPSEKDTDFTKFKTIPNLPPKISVVKRDLWSVYVDWLSEQPVSKYMIESPFYGILDVDKHKPTLVLPGREHPTYVLGRNPFDTADAERAFQKVTHDDAVAYLTKMAECYPTYHQPKFLWPAMGWFVASMFTAFSRVIHKGFPILMISGLAESGKTDLIKFVLSAHLGCQEAQDYDSSTQHSRRKKLASNNIIPLIVDEFRDLDEKKTAAFLALCRTLWDGGTREAGGMEGGSAQDKLQGMMCVIGEHEYQDPATLDRTYAIRVDPQYLRDLKGLDDKERRKLARRAEWLKDPVHRGILGSIILQWMEKNFDEIPDLMRKAKEIVEAQHPELQKLRNIIGISIVVFGLLVIRRIYKEYGVKFPVKLDYIMDAVFAANPAVNTNEAYGGIALKVLFQETDFVITQGLMNNRPLFPMVYDLDIDNSDIAYFDIGRWHGAVKSRMKISQSASLINTAAFSDLLAAAAKNNDSPILGFPKKHPRFPVNCVRIDLSKVRDQFKVNTEGWKDTEVRDYE